jgi:DnaJ-class molecular chaperone
MASSDDTDAPADVPCSACRGTGRVISNLGGSPQEVTCPWCDGTGRFVPGHDAQARHRGEAAG